MKDFKKKEEQRNIFDRLSFWLDDHFETIAGFIIVILVVGIIAFLTYSVEVSRSSVARELLWDLPTDTPGTYVRTDPDTNIEYIIVISSRGGVSICPREGVSNAH